MTGASDGAIDALARELLTSFPADAARSLERFSGGDAAQVLAAIEPATAAQVVRSLSAPIARDALAEMPTGAAARIVAALPAPWVAALLRAAPADRVEAMLATVPANRRSAVTRAMRSRPGTAGALLEPAVLALASDVGVGFALEQVKSRTLTAKDRVYVVDRDGRLVGVVGVADLLVAAPQAPLTALMVADVVSLRHDDDGRAIVASPGWRSWRSLPVVDQSGTLLGVVRYDTLLHLLLDDARPPGGLSLPVSLAELLWLGLTGITDGLARTVTARRETDDR